MDDDVNFTMSKPAQAVIGSALADLRSSSYQQISDNYKWVCAALLTINGGGALAAVNSASKLSDVGAALSFGIGILSVIVGVVAVREATYKAVETILQGQINVANGVYPEEPTPITKRYFQVSDVCEIASLIAFCLGTYLIFTNSRDVSNDRRCLAIQRDILSARPRRTDGPDLFQALGCRPQGEGSVYAPPRISK